MAPDSQESGAFFMGRARVKVERCSFSRNEAEAKLAYHRDMGVSGMGFDRRLRPGLSGAAPNADAAACGVRHAATDQQRSAEF